MLYSFFISRKKILLYCHVSCTTFFFFCIIFGMERVNTKQNKNKKTEKINRINLVNTELLYFHVMLTFWYVSFFMLLLPCKGTMGIRALMGCAIVTLASGVGVLAECTAQGVGGPPTCTLALTSWSFSTLRLRPERRDSEQEILCFVVLY
jgi:hypothetical protein